MTKTYQTAKPATKKKYYKRFEHVNNNNFAKILKIAMKISFLKDNTNIKSDFCDVCSLGKQHKMHSKQFFIDIMDEHGVCQYADLFSGKNILLGIINY